MAPVIKLAQKNETRKPSGSANTKDIVKSHRSPEMFFAVVGPVGAGGSRVMASLERACIAIGYTCVPIKASDLIREWARENGQEIKDSDSRKTLSLVEEYQNAGDKMRESDAAGVAQEMMIEIARERAKATSIEFVPGTPIVPDDQKRAYLIDSIRHPAEVQLLRRTYGNSFALVGVVCEESKRKERVLSKYFTKPEQKRKENQDDVDRFIERDLNDSEKNMVNT